MDKVSTYSFHSISINGRELELKKIIDKSAIALSEFEANTFLFIQQWFCGDDFFTQNTSGSTGAPKSIQITRQQMIASATLTMEALGLQPGDTAFLCLDPAFIAGKMMLVRSFICNMRIVAINPAMNPFKGLPSDIPLDFTALVPSQLDEIVRSSEAQRLNSIKNVIIGGAALSEETRTLLSGFAAHFYATYGMTETISHIALQRLNGSSATPFFELLPGITITYDERKCLVIDAPYLSEKIVTNDLVAIADAKRFKWLGRIDNVINSGGIKVIPEKIESDLRRIFEKLNIQNLFIISSLPDAKLGNQVVLLIEGKIPLNLEDLKSHIRNALHPFENPKAIYTNVQFVRTKSGKINRRETMKQIRA